MKNSLGILSTIAAVLGILLTFNSCEKSHDKHEDNQKNEKPSDLQNAR